MITLLITILCPALLKSATATADININRYTTSKDLSQVWGANNTKIKFPYGVDYKDYNIALGYGLANFSLDGDNVDETVYFPIIKISSKNNPLDILILVPNKDIKVIQKDNAELADENEDPTRPKMHSWGFSQFTSEHENCFSNNWYPYFE